MKLVKSLLLGSAAGLIAVGGAQAADLPVKAKAVEYVKICSLYGAGFYYIPGTDTCIKLGGYLRAEVALNTNSDIAAQQNVSTQGANGARNRLTNYYTMRAREDLNIDTRTATEYGVVRTFFDGVFSWTTGNYVGTNSVFGGTAYSGTLAAGAASANNASLGNGVTLYGSPSGSVNGTDGNTSGGSLGVYYAFIQFAGFTMGKAVSQFDAPWTNYPGNNFDGLVGGSGTVTGVNQFTYTADFGQGVTAAFSAEDVTQYYQAGNVNLSGISALSIVGGSFGTTNNGIGGSRSPNLVAMVRVDQAWGLFQASVAAKDNHVAYYGTTEASGHPDDKWGWAVQLALSIKNIPTGAGDVINISGVYTDGATRYNFQNLAGSNYSMWGANGNGAAYGSVGFGFAPDTVYAGGGAIGFSQQETVKTWGFRGAYTHNWDPYWNTAIYGAYAGTQFGSLAKSVVCSTNGFFSTSAASGVGATAALNGCNPDFRVAQVGIITRWTPVKNLTFSADLTWQHLDTGYSGDITLPSAQAVVGAAVVNGAGSPVAAAAKPTATYSIKDQDSLTLLLRAQRNW
ncbi:polymerase [Bradyrhizobium sacchari]|uniref:Porin n=2 Tax=Bradyrhizobium TaxID=374 RepID=A0A560K6L2_9BRAD|nr:porin [Bradyrhizobium sacchari]OPY97235.1 polymerase [Bradyrhizobium sacchari]TWB55835.1 porin-like protein [Bradyrhizobium sacchari]TWB78856.1 porin-like protein [Bradyrhizobium sacchari]